MPDAANATWHATVPFITAIPWRTPQNAANAFSNFSRYSPADEIQFVSIARVTYFSSLPQRWGWLTGMRSGRRSGTRLLEDRRPVDEVLPAPALPVAVEPVDGHL